MQEIKTLNGMFDARCRRCLMAVYRGWVDKRPPPIGCCEGEDADISKCGAVYNALVSVVIAEDHIKRELIDREKFLLAELGQKGVALMSDIRAHKPIKARKLKEPIYDKPTHFH
jgi:hypothetical protein